MLQKYVHVIVFNRNTFMLKDCTFRNKTIVLNETIYDINTIHELSITRFLHELLLGHTLFGGAFLHQVGPHSTLDALSTDWTFREGGGALRTGDQVTAG